MKTEPSKKFSTCVRLYSYPKWAKQ